MATSKEKFNNNTVILMNTPIAHHANQETQCDMLTKCFEMDVPRFDGSDPLGWIFRINQSLTSISHWITNESRLHLSI